MMKTIKLRSFIALLLALLGWAAWAPQVALAHAELVQSSPEQGETLAQSPTTITLEFSEDLDPNFSKVRLVDSSFQTVVAGPGTINPAQPRVMTLDLPALPDGVYAAVWQARSAARRTPHQRRNQFLGRQNQYSAFPAARAGCATPATAFPPLAETVLRWLSYVTAALATGSIAFGLLVWRPAFRQSSRDRAYKRCRAYKQYLCRR